MSTNFPTTIDSYAAKVDNTTDVMAADINNPQDAIEALEAKVGVDSSAVVTSHDYLFAHLIVTGTIMLFGQNAAPTGWTRKADWQNNAMLCYATGAIGSGGAVNPQSTHTHTGPSHSHTGPNHTHSMNVSTSGDFNCDTSKPIGVDCTTGRLYSGTDSFAIDHKILSAITKLGGTGATGAGGTGATGASSAPHYQEVIAATKD